MKLTKIRALIIFLSFNAIFGAAYNLKNFEVILIPNGISDFSYKITYSPSGLLKASTLSPFIFMKVPIGFEFAFVKENGEYDFEEKKDDNWLSFPLEQYKQNDIINFKLRNKYYTSEYFTFIDYSEEINIDFDTFLNWNYFISFDNDYRPINMTFNIDRVNYDSIVLFSNIDTIGLDGRKFLYYCLNKGGNCVYQELKNITAKKGEKYKIILNPAILNGIYTFYPVSIQKIIKEIEFGKTSFDFDMTNITEQYFILDVKDIREYDYFYLYVNYYYSHFYSSFISEEIKENLIEQIGQISYNYEDTNRLISKSKYSYYYNYGSDYLLIKIENVGYSYLYKSIIYIAKDTYYLGDNTDINIIKGKYTILRKYYHYSEDLDAIDMLISSSKNMILMNSNLEEPTNLLFFNDKGYFNQDIYIFVDSKEAANIKYIYYTNPFDFKFNFVLENDIENILNTYGPDSIFMRTNSYVSNFGFNTSYLFGLDKEYYFYAKKLFGNVEVYQLNKQLNEFSNITDLLKPIQSYETNDYTLITNKLIKVSGYQILSYFNSYGSLYDIYLQKVDDSEHVQLNPNMFKFGNLVKLFERGKKYYLDFTVEHYIKLDSNFLDAKITFTDTDNNNKQYSLSRNNKVIKDLKGDNIMVESDKDALVYFYKIIPSSSTIHVEEFDKTNTGKNMGFTITVKDEKTEEIIIIKDFGFKECYPIISDKNWEFKNVSSFNNIQILAENAYDKLENELYDDEKYFIYIFDSLNEDNLPIFNEANYQIRIEYFNVLSTNVNKYNFEIFPASSSPEEAKKDITSILFSKNKTSITYQFFKCENDNLDYIVEVIGKDGYQKNIKNDFTLNINLEYEEILRYVLMGTKESLLAYHFHNPEVRSEGYAFEGYSIISVNKLENTLLIKFNPVYTSTLTRYHIIAAKKDNSNNKDSFSKPCYLANLMKNDDKIIVKTILEEPLSDIIFISLDISKLVLGQNDEIVVNIISENLHSSEEVLTFYKPIEIKNKQVEYTPIKLNEKTKFDFDQKYRFKYEYTCKNDYPEYLVFDFESNIDFSLLIIDDSKTQIKGYDEDRNNRIELKLTKSGKYYFEFFNDYSEEDDYEYEEEEKEIIDITFTATIENTFIETIDLSKSNYYNLKGIKAYEDREPKFYKVQNLKENKNVIFTYGIGSDISDHYDEDNKINPFKVCNDNTKECTTNVFIYKFLKEYTYTIYISYIKNYHYYYYDEDESPYNFPIYTISPISDKSFENTNEGYHVLSEPKIMIINIEEKKELVVFPSIEICYTYTNDIINNNNINSLELKTSYETTNIFTYSDKKYLIIIPKFSLYGYKGQIIIINLLFNQNKKKYSIPSKKNEFIYLNNHDDDYDDDEEEKEEEEEEYYRNPLDYNILKVYSSPLKNLKTIGINDLPDYNNIALSNHELLKIPLYIDTNKNENKINIDVKTYYSKFAFFGAVDNNLWKLYKDLVLYSALNYKIKDLKELTPFIIRANSDLVELAEYFNLYLSGIQEKINIYIKKLYGPAEFYECEAEPLDSMNYSILTKPISSCKNKKSLFNRFINLGGNKILSGHLDYNSFGEAYVDFDDDNKIISLSYVGKLARLIKNFAKYLKKGKEYDLIIESDYLVKLDPEYEADITISGGKNLKLNSKNPTGQLEKGNYKIKANKDAMVYFYGKLDRRIKQKKIENKTGKIIEITVNGDDELEYLLDFGFEGYMPTNIFFREADVDDDSPLYVENLYEKLQTKLVEGEFLYLYYYDYDNDLKIKLKYSKDNLNNPKNDYTFNVITEDEQDKYLIINNKEYRRILYNINFCSDKKSEVKMYYQRESDSEEDLLIFGEEEDDEEEKYSKRNKIYEESVKLRFESNLDFIFSYSFVDNSDEEFEDSEEWVKERIVYRNLIINEITQKEKSNIISLKFNSNYKQSSTRYIVVVAKKENEYSEENFSNPCFLTKLVTNKAQGVKAVNVYDVGEERVINAEIDVTEILSSNTEYVVNIISQELRFEKKLNFYKPKTFLFGKLYKDKSNRLSAGYIVLIAIGGLIVLAAIAFIVFRLIKKRQNIDFDKKAQEINQEKLLSEM